MGKDPLRATEQRNPRTRGLDTKSTLDILRAIHREDARVAQAVAPALPAIARAVDVISEALQSGGRLIYVGAGTSGRLAALDAAEIPPTFGTPARLVQALIAGGRRALTQAAEGVEDSRAQGARDLAKRRPGRNDVIVGISASGSTPYVLGALELARKRGAVTLCVTSNVRTPLAHLAAIRIIVETGPEPIAGSTRMKAGTAQKMVLNMLSTAVMVRMGRVYDNCMIGVALTNRKLRARGVRMLADVSGATVADATRALRQSGHNMPVALIVLKSGIRAREARRRLRVAGGNLRSALAHKEQSPKRRQKQKRHG
jgi:N-acetylmuramic acid 6-phosphate etherase